VKLATTKLGLGSYKDQEHAGRSVATVLEHAGNSRSPRRL
jgi:hypothetical protein